MDRPQMINDFSNVKDIAVGLNCSYVIVGKLNFIKR
jgi:hypothetical protein